MISEHKYAYKLMLLFCIGLAAVGLVLGDPASVPDGLMKIWTSPAGLIVDYIEFAGIAAAMVNAALVTLLSIAYMKIVKSPVNGLIIGTTGIMAGFALFGKNVFNMIPILIGGYIYTKLKKSDPASTCCISLMCSCMGPVVSFIAFKSQIPSAGLRFILAIIAGIAIGIFMPYLATYTALFQHGMNLYNTGFTCGFIAIFVNALLLAMGETIEITSIWGTSYDSQLRACCMGLSVLFILAGLFLCGESPSGAIKGYKSILARPADDYFSKDGSAGTCINIGINGLVVCVILTAIGGNFNGPTLAGIFSVMGFSAKGKNIRNTWSLYAGLLICAAVMPTISMTAFSVQLGVLFITACAPLVSEFGWPAGIIAGFIHCIIVQKTGGFTGGFNLYNNGFSAGLVCAMLFPVLEAAKKRLTK